MKLILSVPTRKSCALCGVKHRKGEPCEKRSLYYRMVYYRQHKHFPDYPAQGIDNELDKR